MTATESIDASRPMGDDGYSDLFARIAASAATRDAHRELPYDDIAELARRGFGALRVPREFGGAGATVTELTEELLALGSADSNFVQALRTHFLYVESLVQAPASEARTRWLTEIAAGSLFGGGATERGGANSDRFGTRVTRNDDGRLVVSGKKYYSTGSLFADWFVTIGEADDGSLAHVVVKADTPGLSLLDDWDGFGQRLTASGTTVLDNVEVDESLEPPQGAELGSFATSLAQQFHLIALAGIARNAHDEVIEYIRERKRYFAQGPRTLPREDPLVQETVGELSSAVYLAETLVRQIAGELDDLVRSIEQGTATAAQEDHVEVQVYRAQYLVVNAVLKATTRLFDVGGASSVSRDRNWDRFWRNARTLANHNPTSYRLTSIGAYELNGTSPFRQWFSGVDLTARTSGSSL